MRIELEVDEGAAAGGDALDVAAWRGERFDFWGFDRRVDALAAAGAPLALRAPRDEAARFVGEVLIRVQRVARRRNGASAAPWFDRVLAAHAALHDLDKPLVRADLDHALDAWQWTLRLDGAAGAAVQLAALLHDVERLASEADARIEQHAPDYQAFKDAHARAGAALARALLAGAGVDGAIAEAAAALVARHERPGADADLVLLNDADALSFFSLNSPGYVDYFGAEQAARKVAYTLGRMSPRARTALGAVHLRPDVRRLVDAHR